MKIILVADLNRHCVFSTCKWDMPHIWTNHVTYEDHFGCGPHQVMSHVICKWVTSHVNESRLVLDSNMHHICMSYVSHLNDSNVTYERVMSHMSESCIFRYMYIYIYVNIYVYVYIHMKTIWVVSPIRERVMSLVNESCRVWMSHRISQVYIYT